MKNIKLISDTGIQFYTVDFEVNPDEGFTDSSGNFFSPLSLLDVNGQAYSLSFFESFKPVAGSWALNVMVSFSNGQCVSLNELKRKGFIVEVGGKDRLVSEESINFDLLDLVPQENCYSEYSLSGSIPGQLAGGETALKCIENKWLPVPMFELDSEGNFLFGPSGWTRLKLVPVSVRKNKTQYKAIWAFDTATVHGMTSGVKPFFYSGEKSENRYQLCTDINWMINFFSKEFSCEWVDDYLVNLIFGDSERAVFEDRDTGVVNHFRYIAYYLTFISYLSKMGIAPSVSLQDGSSQEKINVDMVLDIGNSRTCGVLYENSDFTKVEMLSLRDLSEPWKEYCKPFDMRLAFHKADFGSIYCDSDQFSWKSFLRVGDEAVKLIYQARSKDGLSEKTTNYSSPKRYLWDDIEFQGQWDFLNLPEDGSYRNSEHVTIDGLSVQFCSDGSLRRGNELPGISSSFSRRSLMTMVMIEIIQQAKCQINSIEFRQKHGINDVPRAIGKIIVTCPTAMPKAEQITLRKCAEEAYAAVLRCDDPKLYLQPYNENDWKGIIQIIPSVKDLITDIHFMPMQSANHDFGYDEASCCQFVYLYAELTKKYMNHCDTFFEMYGHKRQELLEDGYDKNSLTIGSIDMGAGTTDMMICAYKYESGSVAKLTPVPLFWDSFYFAGDDILQEIVQQLIIEGNEKAEVRGATGPIYNAVCNAYMSLPDEDFLDAMNVRGKVVFDSSVSLAEKQEIKQKIAMREASERIHNFFGKDKALMDFKDRLVRHDFNVQISVPMGMKYLEMLQQGRKKSVLGYDDFFPNIKPADFILDHFSKKFSIEKNGQKYVSVDFRDIKWTFDPDAVASVIVPRVEPLISQLAAVLSEYNCDIVLLAGKPMSLRVITDIFLKHYPVSPNRLIRLNEYRVGEWYPFSDGIGYFKDQKSLVAVGAMLGYMASSGGIDGFHMDVSRLKKDMTSTSKYIGIYNTVNRKVDKVLLSPESNTATLTVHGFPMYLGCKRLPSENYQSRPIYSLSLVNTADIHSISFPLKATIVRNYSIDREELKLMSITDANGKSMMSKVRFIVQSIADEGTYWLDKGEFVLSING